MKGKNVRKRKKPDKARERSKEEMKSQIVTLKN
jgi:hypothetical protein